MTPTTFDALPDSFHVVRLPDDPKLTDPALRRRGETFTRYVSRRPAGFRGLEGRPLPRDGHFLPDEGMGE